MALHADDEPELGPDPLVAIVSRAPRRLVVKPRHQETTVGTTSTRQRRPARDGRDLPAALRPRRAPAAWHRTRAHQPDLPAASPRAVTAAPLAPERARDPRGRPRSCRLPFKGGGSHGVTQRGRGDRAVARRPGRAGRGGAARRGSVTAPTIRSSRHRAQQNVGDMPVPNSTELHHTQATSVRRPRRRFVPLDLCVRMSSVPDHLLISRLGSIPSRLTIKIRGLPGTRHPLILFLLPLCYRSATTRAVADSGRTSHS